MAQRYSAGILPYALVDNDMYLLIGKDIRDNTWSDFGGKSEEEDGNLPLNTAIREFYEESCGVVMDIKSIRNRMSTPHNYILLQSHTQNGYPYYMYMVEVPYSNMYRSIFRKLLYFMKYKKIYKKHMEKTDIQWISLKSLLGKRVMLRGVFEYSIQRHLDTIEKLAAMACVLDVPGSEDGELCV
jgi:hypothetical protein